VTLSIPNHGHSSYPPIWRHSKAPPRLGLRTCAAALLRYFFILLRFFLFLIEKQVLWSGIHLFFFLSRKQIFFLSLVRLSSSVGTFRFLPLIVAEWFFLLFPSADIPHLVKVNSSRQSCILPYDRRILQSFSIHPPFPKFVSLFPFLVNLRYSFFSIESEPFPFPLALRENQNVQSTPPSWSVNRSPIH